MSQVQDKPDRLTHFWVAIILFSVVPLIPYLLEYLLRKGNPAKGEVFLIAAFYIVAYVVNVRKFAAALAFSLLAVVATFMYGIAFIHDNEVLINGSASQRSTTVLAEEVYGQAADLTSWLIIVIFVLSLFQRWNKHVNHGDKSVSFLKL